jgi:transcriptional regulator with XRE-family HTH domain
VARVAHDELSGHPSLAVALRWLRHRRRMTQGGLREAVAAAGGRISLIYIQQLEAGRRRPSPAMLERLLGALASDREELARLLEEAAGVAAPARTHGWRPSRRDPVDPSAAGGIWSDEVRAASADGPSASNAVEDRTLPGDQVLVELTELAAGLDASGRRELLRAARRLAARQG